MLLFLADRHIAGLLVFGEHNLPIRLFPRADRKRGLTAQYAASKLASRFRFKADAGHLTLRQETSGTSWQAAERVQAVLEKYDREARRLPKLGVFDPE